MSLTPWRQQLRRQAHVAHLGHARIALRAAVLQHQHRARRRRRASGSTMRCLVVLEVLEHHGAAAVLHQLRRGGRRLEHRAARRQVAAQDADAAVGHAAAGPAGGSPRRCRLGASRTLSQSDWPLTVSASRMRQQAGLAEAAQHARQAAGVVELLHQEAARRHAGRPASACRGRCRVQSSSSSVDADAAGDRLQVDHRVGRAADRGVDADRVLERLAREDLRQASGLRAPSRRCACPTCAPARSGAHRRPGSRRCAAAQVPSASAMQAIVEAVPMVLQVPAERDMPASADRNWCSVDLAGLDLLVQLPHGGARADVLAVRACR